MGLPRLQLGDNQFFAQGCLLQEMINPLVNLSVQISLFTVKSGCETPVDKHFEHEYWIILEGAATLVYEQTLFQIMKDEAFYFLPHATHKIINHTAADIKILSVYWADGKIRDSVL
ncbi:MAG: cupin domain-containing protein [Gammaproteobacteria bacterium]|nr:cupin domain-containing protein [Gammaproteobacteria bacterium]